MKTRNSILSLIIFFGLNNVMSANENRVNSMPDVDSIIYIEEDEATNLDFDTTAYLPADFDPYAAPSDFQHVSFVEEETGLDPVIDTKAYLPAGFDPYEFFFDIHSIDYIEEDQLLEQDLTI